MLQVSSDLNVTTGSPPTASSFLFGGRNLATTNDERRRQLGVVETGYTRPPTFDCIEATARCPTTPAASLATAANRLARPDLRHSCDFLSTKRQPLCSLSSAPDVRHCAVACTITRVDKAASASRLMSRGTCAGRGDGQDTCEAMALRSTAKAKRSNDGRWQMVTVDWTWHMQTMICRGRDGSMLTLHLRSWRIPQGKVWQLIGRLLPVNSHTARRSLSSSFLSSPQSRYQVA